jgi:5-oxoprolinase (ATP-hydrolysing)
MWAAAATIADIGGTTPGSMPPFSTRIEEEGVQINNVKLVERGVLREADMIALLQSGEHPSRNPAQNLADLKAQIAANEKGVQELRKMVEHFGLGVVQAYMGHVQDNAEESVRRVISAPQGWRVFAATGQRLGQIRVAIRVDRCTARRRRSTSAAPASSSRTTSMRRRRSRWPRCCMCSARWSTTRSR